MSATQGIHSKYELFGFRGKYSSHFAIMVIVALTFWSVGLLLFFGPALIRRIVLFIAMYSIRTPVRTRREPLCNYARSVTTFASVREDI